MANEILEAVVDVLLNHGADCNLRNKINCLPITLAIKHNAPESVLLKLWPSQLDYKEMDRIRDLLLGMKKIPLKLLRKFIIKSSDSGNS